MPIWGSKGMNSSKWQFWTPEKQFAEFEEELHLANAPSRKAMQEKTKQKLSAIMKEKWRQEPRTFNTGGWPPYKPN